MMSSPFIHVSQIRTTQNDKEYACLSDFCGANYVLRIK